MREEGSARQPAVFAGPRRDDWRTPAWLREKVRDQYRPTWDLAACAESSLAPRFYSLADPFLGAPRAWDGVAWLNPPFSRAEEFFANVAASVRAAPCAQLVAIYKANLETATWQEHILPTCSWVFAPRGRVAYEQPAGGDDVNVSSPQFGSLLVGWNVPPPRGIPGNLLTVKGNA